MNEQHNIRLVVETVLKDKGVLKKVAADLNRLDKQQKKNNTSLRSLRSNYLAVAAALGAVYMGAKKTYKAINEGADQMFVESKFARWAQQLGTSADALMNDLIPAARGTASEFDIMNMALDLMSLGLAKNHGHVVRLSNVAVKLGMNMDQLVLTLTNKTIRRFDSLGISVDGFKERWSELKETMTDEDAFTQAFLEQAEKQLEITGEAADNIKGTYMGLEASWDNYANRVKQDLAIMAEDGAKWATNLINKLNESAASEDAFDVFLESYGAKVSGQGGLGADFMGENLSILTGMTADGTYWFKQYGEQVEVASGTVDKWLSNMQWRMDNTGDTMEDFNFQTTEQIWAFNEQTDAMRESAMYLEEYELQQAAIAAETAEVSEQSKLAGENVESYLNALDPGRAGMFAAMLEKIKFAQAGGEETTDFANMFFDADGNLADLNLTLDETQSLLEAGHAASLATKVNMKDMTLWKARQELYDMVRDWDRVMELLPSVEEAFANLEIEQGALEYMDIMGGTLSDARDSVREIMSIMGNLDGMTSTLRINIMERTIAGSTQNNWDPMGPSAWPTGDGPGFASGGNLGAFPTNAIAEVGEEGSEFVINGMVIPAPITRWLKAAGMRAGKAFADGGVLLDGVFGGTNLSSYADYSAPVYGAGGLGVAGTSSDPSYSPEAEVAAAAATAETATRSAAKATQTVTTRMTQTLSASSAEQNKTLKNIYAVLLNQPTTDGLTDAMKSAVQEALAQ
jgi:hypothetical protein